MWDYTGNGTDLHSSHQEVECVHFNWVWRCVYQSLKRGRENQLRSQKQIDEKARDEW
jgi:hypothetical protein